jgi:hypothetical protein
MRRIDLESWPRGGRRGLAEQRLLDAVQAGILHLGRKDLAKVLVNGAVVVDDQDATMRSRLVVHRAFEVGFGRSH